ncbi:MAG: hypothetical protein H0V82_04370 [Candidatus Protochlamydia sp.]|nr:hypothetical protein [Candidatus Protochlamydia sp.]
MELSKLISNYRTPKAKLEDLKSHFAKAHEEFQKNKSDAKLITAAIHASLSLAGVSSPDVEASWVAYASNCNNFLKQENYFSPLGHYFDYLITRFKGIDCKDIFTVRKALLQLKRSLELDPSSEVIKKEFKNLQNEINSTWATLRKKNEINETTFEDLEDQLEKILREDAFKDEFQENPALFKFIKEAPETFKDKHPYLLTINDFIYRYPKAANIEYEGSYSTEKLQKILHDAKHNPIIKGIYLLWKEPQINLTDSMLIKEFLIKNPQMHIYFGNSADGNMLLNAFESEENLSEKKKSLAFKEGKISNFDGKIYSYYIDYEK